MPLKEYIDDMFHVEQPIYNYMKIDEKYKKLIREITIAVLSAILTWLGVSRTNMLSIQKNVKDSRMSTENKTDGKVSADSTSINLFNKEGKKWM